MRVVERLGLAVLHRLNPEVAHDLSLRALRAGLVPLPGPIGSDRLRTRLAGIELSNPLGLAAGYDKNAVALAPLMRAGFGFLEVGAATPRPQPGNAKPRLFRLAEDRAAINRFGFNNEGGEAIARRLATRPPGVPVGINIGTNKDSSDRLGDFARVLSVCGPHVDFATINVSSPNMDGLRRLQAKVALRDVLDRVAEAQGRLERRITIFLKIAPDLYPSDVDDIAEVALEKGIDGIIATNTTLDREGLRSARSAEPGGLSGRPLFERSTRVLARLSEATGGVLPLIGAGGVASGADAYAKIRAGASAVQIYTALVYDGMSLVPRILDDLDARLAQGGFDSVAEAVGTGRGDWL